MTSANAHATKKTLAQMVSDNATIADIAASGHSIEEIAAILRANAEQANRTAQAALVYDDIKPSPQRDARKAWLLDGQAIHGELKEFFWPAMTALQADDWQEFSRQRDLLFKAIRTFIGDPPPPATT